MRDKAHDKTYQEAYKLRHKELGLCPDCPQKALVRGYCLRHYYQQLIYDRNYSNRNREKRNKAERDKRKRCKEEGRCIDCGMPLQEDTNTVRCVNCQEKNNIGR